MKKRNKDELEMDRMDEIVAGLHAKSIDHNIAQLLAMLCEVFTGKEIVNQRKWQDDWNKYALPLNGRVPVYPKKLVR